MTLLFNIADLKELLKDYHTLTHMRVAIFDDQFHEIASHPNHLSSYCHLVRSDEAAFSKCTQCDYAAFLKCKKSQTCHIYQCHAGLTEAIVPILADKVIIGYIMLGQVLQTNDRNSLWEKIMLSLTTYKIDFDQLHRTFMNRQLVDADQLKSSAKMMEICANYLYASHKLVLKKDSLAHKIDHYIGSHLQEELSVPMICQEFDLGKTKLYEISNESYGMGIAKHICQIRMQRAKEYLSDTRLPIYQIAEKVGITDYNYFTKMFKNETGVTPKAFRKEYLLP